MDYIIEYMFLHTTLLMLKNMYYLGNWKKSTCSTLEQVQLEGSKKVTRQKDYYNLDIIISISFRVNSKIAIKFRKWVNKIIKRYMIKGFSLK